MYFCTSFVSSGSSKKTESCEWGVIISVDLFGSVLVSFGRINFSQMFWAFLKATKGCFGNIFRELLYQMPMLVYCLFHIFVVDERIVCR